MINEILYYLTIASLSNHCTGLIAFSFTGKYLIEPNQVSSSCISEKKIPFIHWVKKRYFSILHLLRDDSREFWCSKKLNTNYNLILTYTKPTEMVELLFQSHRIRIENFLLEEKFWFYVMLHIILVENLETPFKYG